MSQSNLEIIKDMYAAFGRGDVEAVVAMMSPGIVWNEAENNKLADRNPYIGPQSILEGVFTRLFQDFDDFQVLPEQFVASDDQVVMHGRYSAKAKSTGLPANPQIVHWWTLKDGKVTAFQQYVDTLALARSLGEI